MEKPAYRNLDNWGNFKKKYFFASSLTFEFHRTCTCGIMEPWGDCNSFHNKDACKSGEECVKNPEFLKCISSGGCFCQSQ